MIGYSLLSSSPLFLLAAKKSRSMEKGATYHHQHVTGFFIRYLQGREKRRRSSNNKSERNLCMEILG
ncbi:hypothetical protein L6452_17598 [Arctium lappa]|uniref:Uncharacterized protein n=1 Tax=Arctium lappa TaxID=4217 RepID=A0ACB9C3X8_ARCLA|nr:hypothetical protein L6452_17598 [Arctium lappa]